MVEVFREAIIKRIGPEPYEVLCNSFYGIIAGYIIVRLAKSTAFAAGLGLTIFEMWASRSSTDLNSDWIYNWSDVRQYCEERYRGSSENLRRLLQFPQHKGFIGGLLIGASFT